MVDIICNKYVLSHFELISCFQFFFLSQASKLFFQLTIFLESSWAATLCTRYHSCCSGRSGHLAQQIMALTNLLFTPTKNNANWQRKPLAECCLCSHFLKKWCLMFDVRRKNNAKSLQHFTRRVRSGKKCIHFSLHY